MVDALTASGFKGRIDSVFAKGEIVEGCAMLTGSVAGGYLAQATNLGWPYVLRAIVLALSFGFAFVLSRPGGGHCRRSPDRRGTPRAIPRANIPSAHVGAVDGRGAEHSRPCADRIPAPIALMLLLGLVMYGVNTWTTAQALLREYSK